jgi:hypothetical protein
MTAQLWCVTYAELSSVCCHFQVHWVNNKITLYSLFVLWTRTRKDNFAYIDKRKRTDFNYGYLIMIPNLMCEQNALEYNKFKSYFVSNKIMIRNV